MKFSTTFLSCLLVSGLSAFAPKSFAGSKQSNVVLSENKIPFFGNSKAKSEPAEEQSLDDEIESLVQEELQKSKRMSNLRNAKGVDYAPWMNISEEDEDKIRQLMIEKKAARDKRQEQERSVTGALLMDSQAQELSGVGLSYKVLGEDVELEWATSREANTEGFLVKRRAAKTDEFEILASYEDWNSLASKGLEGGLYRFLDDTAGPGGWVYRITEIEKSGRENDISQCLVDVTTQEEQRGAIIAAGGIAVLLGGLVVAGIALDPNGGF